MSPIIIYKIEGIEAHLSQHKFITDSSFETNELVNQDTVDSDMKLVLNNFVNDNTIFRMHMSGLFDKRKPIINSTELETLNCFEINLKPICDLLNLTVKRTIVAY